MRFKIAFAFFSMMIALSLVSFVIADQITPAPQMDRRGEGEQIRPANQMMQEKGYSADVGSSYSSDGLNQNSRDDQIRPAAQTDNRGVEEQIRPANQMMQEKGYSADVGSSYSSDGLNQNSRDDQIRPAAQTDNRGVEEQIRPANQNMEKGYSADVGSDYSSDGSNSNDRDYQIRPAAQTDNKGVEEQIRPANQNMEKGFTPNQGSDYSSGGSSSDSCTSCGGSGSNNVPISDENSGGGNDVVSEEISPDIIVPTILTEFELESDLTSGQTDAAGFGEFFIDTVDNTFDFDITYENLGSAETSANIKNNEGIIFALPLGMSKFGTWNYNEAFEFDLLNGNTIVSISSMLFPGGELIGTILQI